MDKLLGCPFCGVEVINDVIHHKEDCYFSVHGDGFSSIYEVESAEWNRRAQIVKQGEPCSHAGCLHHVTHPCEGCGRIAGRTVKQEQEPITCRFPERDESKPAEQQGLFRKFIVQRVDRSDQFGGKHYGCEYYVLDLTHDEHAPAALHAYALSCKDTHPQLSVDLLTQFPHPPADAQQQDVAHEIIGTQAVDSVKQDWRILEQQQQIERLKAENKELHKKHDDAVAFTAETIGREHKLEAQLSAIKQSLDKARELEIEYKCAINGHCVALPRYAFNWIVDAILSAQGGEKP